MLTQVVAAVARDTVRVVDTLRIVDTVWVMEPRGGFVEELVAWSTVVVGAAAAVALVLPILERRRERGGVDAAITVDAYQARRILRQWIAALETKKTGGRVPPQWLVTCIRAAHEVEPLFGRAITAAPHASPRVRAAIRKAYAVFYRLVARPPLEVDALAGPAREEELEAKEAAELADLRACVARLTDAIDPALRDK